MTYNSNIWLIRTKPLSPAALVQGKQHFVSENQQGKTLGCGSFNLTAKLSMSGEF